jgi:hypothetical protein
MLWPPETYTYLVTGVILISASSYLFYKIYRGSKSRFAYILITFTMLDGVVDFSTFFINVYTHPIFIGGQVYHAVNPYTNQTRSYFYYLGTL